jgi:uncharacterized membrane protein
MTAPDPTRKARLFLGTIFTGAGIAHLVKREVFEQGVPKQFFQWRKPISAVTGVIQILSGIAMYFPTMRAFARWSTVGLLVPTLPFAVDHIKHPDALRKLGVPRALASVAVVAQILVVALTWWATRSRLSDQN